MKYGEAIGEIGNERKCDRWRIGRGMCVSIEIIERNG